MITAGYRHTDIANARKEMKLSCGMGPLETKDDI
jgi:hypothetical protein